MPSRDHGWTSESWWGATTPTTGPTGTSAIWSGQKFGIETPGVIEGFRVYVDTSEDGNYFGFLSDDTTKETLVGFKFRVMQSHANKWQQTWIFPRLKHTDTNRLYRLCVLFPNGKRYQTNNVTTGGPVQHGNITFTNGFTTTSLAAQVVSPTLTANAMGIDVLFHAE